MRFLLSSYKHNTFMRGLLTVDLRLPAVGLAILLYGLFGSPTPTVFGFAELLVGGLLLFGIGLDGVHGVLWCVRGQARWFRVGQVFLIYGLIAGVFGGVMNGADIGVMVRDILPFGFMFLPLFLLGFFERFSQSLVFLYAFIAFGLVFALRASAPIAGISFDVGYDVLYYLGNSPAVLFAALFLFGMGLQGLGRRVSVVSVWCAAILFCLSIIAFVPIVITDQRAGMGAFAIYAVLSMGILFLRAPRRMVVVGSILILVVIAVFSGVIGSAFEGIQAKSALVGANMRAEEWAAVWDAITVHPLLFLFGQGWGASFASPAVADIEVTFTHSLLSSMLLKLGFVGLLLCSLYIAALLSALISRFRHDPIMVMAITAPLLIDVFLYAAFKSLDFGLLLALVPMGLINDYFYGDRESQAIAS